MTSKIYSYKGFTFYRTSVLHGNTGKYLYEIAEIKELSSRPRPYLLTVQDCKDYIADYIRPYDQKQKYFR